MKTIKLKGLKGPVLIGESHHENGDVVHVPDNVAAEYARLGHADPAEGQPAHNADTVNHLADAISPAPPEGHVAAVLDNTPQYKKDQAPGLGELQRASDAGAPRRAARTDQVPAVVEPVADLAKSPKPGK